MSVNVPFLTIDIISFLIASFHFSSPFTLVDVQLDKKTVKVMQELAREIGMAELNDNTQKRITKACYGQKLASRQFYEDLLGYLKEIGFQYSIVIGT